MTPNSSPILGVRPGADEPLQWYWAPIKDYPPFQELVKLRDGS
jgi:hypothetical protein